MDAARGKTNGRIKRHTRQRHGKVRRLTCRFVLARCLAEPMLHGEPHGGPRSAVGRGRRRARSPEKLTTPRPWCNKDSDSLSDSPHASSRVDLRLCSLAPGEHLGVSSANVPRNLLRRRKDKTPTAAMGKMLASVPDSSVSLSFPGGATYGTTADIVSFGSGDRVRSSNAGPLGRGRLLSSSRLMSFWFDMLGSAGQRRVDDNATYVT